ncbi:hypothetical protein SAMN05443637_10858 [Pseudonocardia thermophila]|jgi:hypothetical protein|uniref:Uncharacterized protein n=1 Tax=Pseudonocardia thermophila TaxID=1848 RepID=A0A1M6THT5_PSETH|nr:hypothetical protein [Pseudonocardia thermophila]SHK56622.1 hypothetical protein SAMN05443637_10858 [Pseudonocardia thermophila]
MTAAEDYRRVIAQLDEVADELRARDAERVTALHAELADLDRAVEDAQARAALTRFVVDIHWETALEALWPESWMKLRPKPGPDPRARTADLEAHEAAVAEQLDVLLAAVRRRFRFPGF